MKTTEYFGNHNVIELLKNQLTIQCLANQMKMKKGLKHIITTQTGALTALAQKSGINVEQIEAELRDELQAGIKDFDKGMEMYFGNVNKRTGMSRDEFKRIL